MLVLSINFFSDEWKTVKGWLEESIKNELIELERTTNEKDADKARGALRALRRLLEKESKKQP